ncbi:AmmeMemoRadiSam system protein A [Clostridium sp. Cult2]|uniref:AmmeMemoRadiSam system protein A n=1 Tax=Clostridium sp. Cult2 TaxID=2079003 RepID=UPI001F184EAF|nr:AmmeMemoRadiSam system protein A [Clostridium sp. Cult2]MCF6464352.1 AMMECR1 domain-containing protein [Clostridium sp. Cult2]
MGKILSAYLFPHPPIIVEEIGRGEEKRAKETIEGSKKLAKDIKDKKPSTIITITPHGPLFRDAISISTKKILKGDFKNFGERSLHYEFENDLELVNNIIEKSNQQNISIARVDENLAEDFNISLKLDHGALVPLYFVGKEYNDYKLVHITYGLLPPKDLYRFGQIIQDSVLESEKNVVLIASGDLSHKLSDEGPYSYSPYGEKFDKKIVNILKEGDFKSIVSFDLSLSERAGECGLRSLMILSGFLDGFNVEPDVLSYEGPFGIGYCNAKFSVLDKENRNNIFEDLIHIEKERIAEARESEDEYVRLARASLEHYVKHNEKIKIPEGLSEELLNDPHGAFVTLKKDGLLRGCIGTIKPTQKNLAMEIIENAISAGLRDPRFDPVREEELPELVYSVDVLKEPEPISSIEELDVEKYGVIVSKGFTKGLLLPNLEGVDTPEEQIRIALNKAGIGEYEDYKLERFEVIRHF